MAAYFQMGHDSENLVRAEGLEAFKGVILSPVNRGPEELMTHVQRFRSQRPLDIILDPQLYFPRSNRGRLVEQPYFPSDLDTADLSSDAWWSSRISAIAEFAVDLQVDAVCSPLTLPGNSRWSPDYYVHALSNFLVLREKLKGFPVRPVMTLTVSWDQMTDAADAMRVASIVTRDESPQDVYLIVEAGVTPRKELGDDQRLFALMSLVSALERAGSTVLASHCSSEVLLLKSAGATHCSTGKFFNLRRFSRSRFQDEEESNGRQIPYWFEHGLMAFLREADVRRIQQDPDARGVIATGLTANQFSTEILSVFEEARIARKAQKWLALSWKQYLAWFAAVEAELSSVDARRIASDWLRTADANWGLIEEKGILLDERLNNGAWVRAWRQALLAFDRAKSE